MLQYFKFFLLIIFINSCSIINFEELDIQISIPQNSNYYNKDFIDITFSIVPSLESVKNIINLKDEYSFIDIDYIQNDKTITIKPINGFINRKNYTLYISGRIKMQDGRYYTISETRNFVYRGDVEKFYISEYSMPKDSVSKNLNLTFSKPVDPYDFDKKFTITPSVIFNSQYNNDNLCITVTPSDTWKTNTLYTWSYENGISQDNTIIEDITGDFFIYKKNYELPEILSAEFCSYNFTGKINETGNEINAVKICSNKKLNEKSFKYYISVTPQVNFDLFFDNSECYLIFSKRLEPNTKYDFILKKEYSDEDALSPITDQIVSLTTKDDIIRVKKLIINDIIITPADSSKIFCTACKEDLTVTVDLESEITNRQLNKILTNINLNSIFPYYVNVPKIKEYTMISTKSFSITFTSITKPQNSRHYYELKFNKIIQDFNFLEENLCVNFYLY